MYHRCLAWKGSLPSHPCADTGLYGCKQVQLTLCKSMVCFHSWTLVNLVPVCNPTLRVIGLQIPCMERSGFRWIDIEVTRRFAPKHICTRNIRSIWTSYLLKLQMSSAVYRRVWYQNVQNLIQILIKCIVCMKDLVISLEYEADF